MKGKGDDNNTNLVEQVCSLQVSARVFAAAAMLNLTLMHLIVKMKRGCSERLVVVPVCPSFGKPS